MPAVDALVRKADLARDLRDSHHARAVIEASFAEALPPGTDVCAVMAQSLGVGEAFYVAPQMMDLVTTAAATFPAELPEPADAPSLHGFCWLPSPLLILDITGQHLTVNAVLWSARAGGVDLVCWTDKYAQDDWPNQNLRRTAPEQFAALPALTPSHLARIDWHQPLPKAAHTSKLVPTAADVHVDTSNPDLPRLRVRDPDTGHDEFIDLDASTADEDPAVLFVLTMWRLMQQPLTTTTPVEAAPRLRTLLAKANQPDRHVSVIELRRTAQQHSPGGGQVAWTHRWLVRGHWRRQPYLDPHTGQTIHRAIWIHPHIKGPDGLPLLARERVNALVR